MTGEVTLPQRVLRFKKDDAVDPSLEWIVTNGIGGYASGPVAGGVSRRFHGVLIASLPVPIGRLLCLAHLGLTVLDGKNVIAVDHLRLGEGEELPSARLTEFALDGGLPVWRYESGNVVLEKRVVMPYGRNLTHVLFKLLSGPAGIRLRLRPLFHVRPHEGLVTGVEPAHAMRVDGPGVALEFAEGLPEIRLWTTGPRVTSHLEENGLIPVTYAVERSRGYDFLGRLWAPGWIDVDVPPEGTAAFSVATEPWEVMHATAPDDALAAEQARRVALLEAAGQPTDAFVAELTLAADHFIVAPVGRVEEVARARAAGDEPRTVIAGYHWFTDWGRDTMISLEGLTLASGRTREAGCILRTFGHYVHDGLIPNMFPEGARVGLYHTADATLWFFHALHRYLRVSGDQATLTSLLPTLVDIAEHHVRGTSFGIGVDPADGLLRQGAEGYQLTWMDAKVGDWVVTPRRGKAVEINALWYNALCLLARWLADVGREEDAGHWRAVATRSAESFNRRFWNPAAHCLFDVIDGEGGDDPAIRPNQIFAISLDYPVLDPARWPETVDTVRSELVTPLGLRTLSRGHHDYRASYDGDLHARDAAYHQGTVWAWLIGPFIDAWKRVHPGDQAGLRHFLSGFVTEMDAAAVGTISEVFDAEPPYTARGCISQAWSVAEVLRAWRSMSS